MELLDGETDRRPSFRTWFGHDARRPELGSKPRAVAWGKSHARQLMEQGYWQPSNEPLMLQATTIEEWPSRPFDVIIECVPEQVSLKPTGAPGDLAQVRG